MTTQLDLTDFQRFPWLCDNAIMDGQTPNAIGEQDPDEEEYEEDIDDRELTTAFWCKSKGYRILVCECMGWKCPSCRPHHAEIFDTELSSAKTEGNP